MVRFFNQKEEVMTLTLTPYGKQKFSEGKFSPKHYAFMTILSSMMVIMDISLEKLKTTLLRGYQRRPLD